MDRDLAARNPKAADNWQREQAAKAMLTPSPEELAEIPPRPRARQVFLALAQEIRDDADRLIEERNRRAKDLW